ncbi:bifunctional folylpolyglutamate synthase/dihydrofolate synthase [Sphingomonas sp. S1-29]|uniref:bifunctional folylpolyglutamate synthase/dihydrofolate synthase n=1 Tax=Sphingomonas sp. S1-29 TaxID=2991074 RepID=UPI002240388A|nr:folylpolyglutamate synthase/dihydrofolate synthase family protein [Sphingomonas sp. S1-29]UZK69744.1 bifunctional folylpolyglutamate synthase/dihydrofolate synthase [Sphingomonas sp. S1-29]
MDHARSFDPLVQAQLDRLTALGPGADVLGLDRITRLLARLGDPHLALPPVFHVAGTNGKGSTCAFLRTALEASGYRVHVYTSPHLVRFNERIRVAGTLIDDAVLGPLLAEVLDKGGDIGASFFEVTTAAAFLAFARTPADACVIEVGLGGRLDATNVVQPLVTGIAGLGIDHQAFLGNTLLDIAGEKAGIAKRGVPLVTQRHAPAITEHIAAIAEAAGAPQFRCNRDWRLRVGTVSANLLYRDEAIRMVLPAPTLPGPHQARNLGLAIAMLRRQSALAVPIAALTAAARDTRWPARMQRLAAGPLLARLPAGSAIWVDGAHNRSAAQSLAQTLAIVAGGEPVAAILGVLANKDADGILEALAPQLASVRTVPVPGHAHFAPADLAERARALGIDAAPAADVPAAVDSLGDRPRRVVILGSLYLAGEVLAANDELPT